MSPHRPSSVVDLSSPIDRRPSHRPLSHRPTSSHRPTLIDPRLLMGRATPSCALSFSRVVPVKPLFLDRKSDL